MTKEQYRKLKQKEGNANKGKNLGKVGITTFKSRSFDEWQKAGGKNLFPVDPTKVKNKKDIGHAKKPLDDVKKNTKKKKEKRRWKKKW